LGCRFDDRGHLCEPHIGRVFGLGTLNIRHYLQGIAAPLASGGVLALAGATFTARPLQHGATDEEVDYLLDQDAGQPLIPGHRVEPNALSSAQLIKLIEDKLKDQGVTKVVPSANMLKESYEAFANGEEPTTRFAHDGDGT